MTNKNKMKYITTLLFSLILFSCGTQKKVSDLKCPENGVCTTEKHQNTTLIIKKDDIGSMYHQMEEHTDKTVFVYRFEQNKDEAYVDGHYNEEIIFEVDDSIFDKSFNKLKPNKILFGVFCYCKGKAGYYEVKNASVSYDKKSEIITVTIDEVIENQVLKTVEISNN